MKGHLIAAESHGVCQLGAEGRDGCSFGKLLVGLNEVALSIQQAAGSCAGIGRGDCGAVQKLPASCTSNILSPGQAASGLAMAKSLHFTGAAPAWLMQQNLCTMDTSSSAWRMHSAASKDGLSEARITLLVIFTLAMWGQRLHKIADGHPDGLLEPACLIQQDSND